MKYGIQEIYGDMDDFEGYVSIPEMPKSREYPLLPWMKECIMNKNNQNGNFQRNGEIALAPRNGITEKIESYINRKKVFVYMIE